ncbi:hypothetical protein G7054_g8742 [Neopestalotiopsis clavispora]|nr:hypothetical protein G7054_g8742 [Neopestalotiopsis clavispora]
MATVFQHSLSKRTQALQISARNEQLSEFKLSLDTPKGFTNKSEYAPYETVRDRCNGCKDQDATDIHWRQSKKMVEHEDPSVQDFDSRPRAPECHL